MIKLFIDTNKYLDFYRYKEENIEVLNKLAQCKNILITEQVIDEFERNRIKELQSVKDKIHELNSRINTKSFNIEPIGIYENLIKEINSNNSQRINEIKKDISQFEDNISNIINSLETDSVNNTFLTILNNKKTIIYKHNDLYYQKALKRNNLGGIPRSDKNGFHTICDEYIWETLIHESNFDICFVTRDKTYLNNQDLLTKEYKEKTGKDIVFVDTISDGLAYLGTYVSKYATEIEGINNYELSNPEQSEYLEFVNLNEEQKNVFNYAISLADKAVKAKKKQVLIVNASTGTGKTTIAANLLIKFIEKNYKATFVSNRLDSRNQFYNMIKDKYKNKYLKNLLVSSSAFIEVEENTYDCLIVDDAQRLQAKSGIFQNLGENQIKEIIEASYFTIFFVDEFQKTSFKEIGTIDEIKKYSQTLNADFTKINLNYPLLLNFNYLSWLNYLLYNEYLPKNINIDYDFKVFYNPNTLREEIIKKNNENHNSRLVAGYCWNWNRNGRNNSNVTDIEIPEFNFSMSWNVIHSKNWNLVPESINEIGSVHVVQGIKLDYVGVIIGEDMRLSNNKIITDYTKRATTDRSFSGINKKLKENKEDTLMEADTLIRNTYKILMSRGIKGCYVYCVDHNLGKYMEKEFKKINKKN